MSDCRTIVKTLVCGVKTITWCVNNCKAFGAGQPKFGPKETYLFIRLLKYGLQCLNIYRIQVVIYLLIYLFIFFFFLDVFWSIE